MSEENKHMKKCFFITPIGNEDSIEFKKLTDLLENVINVVLAKCGYETVVAHKIHKIGSIGDQVFTEIINSDLIISNLTSYNPNVMYETAVAHSFGKPTIMISEKSEGSLPFDLIAERTIFYENTIGGTGNLINEIESKINEILKTPEVDNPVHRVIKQTHIAEAIENSNVEADKVLFESLNRIEDKVNSLLPNKILKNENSDVNNYAKLYIYFSHDDEIKKSQVLEVIDNTINNIDLEINELELIIFDSINKGKRIALYIEHKCEESDIIDYFEEQFKNSTSMGYYTCKKRKSNT